MLPRFRDAMRCQRATTRLLLPVVLCVASLALQSEGHGVLQLLAHLPPESQRTRATIAVGLSSACSYCIDPAYHRLSLRLLRQPSG